MQEDTEVKKQEITISQFLDKRSDNVEGLDIGDRSYPIGEILDVIYDDAVAPGIFGHGTDIKIPPFVYESNIDPDKYEEEAWGHFLPHLAYAMKKTETEELILNLSDTIDEKIKKQEVLIDTVERKLSTEGIPKEMSISLNAEHIAAKSIYNELKLDKEAFNALLIQELTERGIPTEGLNQETKPLNPAISEQTQKDMAINSNFRDEIIAILNAIESKIDTLIDSTNRFIKKIDVLMQGLDIKEEVKVAVAPVIEVSNSLLKEEHTNMPLNEAMEFNEEIYAEQGYSPTYDGQFGEYSNEESEIEFVEEGGTIVSLDISDVEYSIPDDTIDGIDATSYRAIVAHEAAIEEQAKKERKESTVVVKKEKSPMKKEVSAPSP